MACGQAQTMEQLIAFRLLQGLGAGGVLPINQTILGDVFPLEERARITGLFSTVWGVSGLLGPAIGGFLTEHVSWRLVFYVNFPLCVLSMLLIGSFLHERVARKGHRIDYIGAISLSAAVGLLLVAMQLNAGWWQVVLYLAAFALVPVFVWQELRAPEPLVPLWLFRRRVIGVSTLAGILLGIALYGQSAFVPPFIQAVMGTTPTVSGFVLAGSSVAWPVASTVGGRLLLRFGFRMPCLLGGALLTLGFGLLLLLGPTTPLWVPFGIECVLGAGFGFVTISTVLAAQTAVGWEHRGVVTSANQFARNMGGTVGVSIAGAIFSVGVASLTATGVDPNDLLSPTIRSTLPAGSLGLLETVLTGALHSVYGMFAVVSAAVVLVGALLPGGRPHQVSDAGGPESLAEAVTA
jgi:MFS family permease